ncbi:hypothetical protein JGU71_16000 [Antrihabitans sp. YC3-6]|uniref:Uncharacterized protein n=1 Tax=Antrihabitans stalagmiti TaxID=2799499 RepID=A0A934U4C1_9NOCA|nr:hypothetical protein [Antrihabitans stalagmiti]MBJ8340395.1 hypothetical protein [Antrihabitans stalagmiti]
MTDLQFGYRGDDLDEVDSEVGSAPIGSSAVRIELDGSLLPTAVEISRNWHELVGAAEIGREIFAAYNQAVAQFVVDSLSAGKLEHRGAIPPRRTQHMVLLETTTWDEYAAASAAMFDHRLVTVHGHATDRCEPAVTVLADRTSILRITVWSEWAQTARAGDIEGEILWCADQLRQQQPVFAVRGDYTPFSDEELAAQHSEHRFALIRSRSTNG